jgi:hypothetical protein
MDIITTTERRTSKYLPEGYDLHTDRAVASVTINRETRQVEFFLQRINGEQRDGQRAWRSTEVVALFSKGNGGKLWPERLDAWMQPDGSLRVAYTTTLLNRSGYRAVEWADKQPKHRSEHNSARA